MYAWMILVRNVFLVDLVGMGGWGEGKVWKSNTIKPNALEEEYDRVGWLGEYGKVTRKAPQGKPR